MMTIPTYFSHSYRLEDQELNKAFWGLFSEFGFSFFVDPPSDTTIHTHLERMMNRCSAFVAVVNRRDVRRFHCSRFILYEYGLSIQARRPRLLLIDNNVPREPFEALAEDEKYGFSSHRPLQKQAELRRKIELLQQKSKAFPNRLDQPRGEIALMLPPKGKRCDFANSRTLSRIEEAADRATFHIAVLRIPHEHNAFFALDLDRYEAVILDVRGTELPDWVFAYLYGRLIPTIKLAQVFPDETPAEVPLPPLVEGLRMDEDEPGVESVTYWRDADDLVWQLARAFEKLDEHETSFKEGLEGKLYFESIGRRPARVFISNAGQANPLARRLSEELRLRGIERFQYKEPRAIATGSKWPAKLRHEVQVCDLFVALIGPGYTESEWCMKELNMARARDRLEMLPFMAEKTSLAFMGEVQVPELPSDQDTAVARLLDEIQGCLTAGGRGHNVDRRRTTLLGASRESIIDATRQLSPVAWRKLQDRMKEVGVVVEQAGHRGGPPRSRGIAEQVFMSAERAQADSELDANPLGALVATLAGLVPRNHKAALRKIAARMTARPGA